MPYVQAVYGEAPEEQNFRKLLIGRIDIWIANISNIEYLLSKKIKSGDNKAERVIGLSDVPITNEVNVYPIFYNNENGQIYAKMFTHGIQKLRNSGLLDNILKKYGLKDWK